MKQPLNSNLSIKKKKKIKLKLTPFYNTFKSRCVRFIRLKPQARVHFPPRVFSISSFLFIHILNRLHPTFKPQVFFFRAFINFETTPPPPIPPLFFAIFYYCDAQRAEKQKFPFRGKNNILVFSLPPKKNNKYSYLKQTYPS